MGITRLMRKLRALRKGSVRTFLLTSFYKSIILLSANQVIQYSEQDYYLSVMTLMLYEVCRVDWIRFLNLKLTDLEQSVFTLAKIPLYYYLYKHEYDLDATPTLAPRDFHILMFDPFAVCKLASRLSKHLTDSNYMLL